MRSVSQTTSSGGFSSASWYLQELPVGRVEVLVLALVLPAEEALLPDVGPALAAGRLRRAALEGEPLALRVGGDRVGVADEPAQVDEVGLRRRTARSARRGATWRRTRWQAIPTVGGASSKCDNCVQCPMVVFGRWLM